MTAFNVVRFRVKPDREAEFLELIRVPGHEVKSGLRRAWVIRTGKRSHSLIGERDRVEAILAARADVSRPRPSAADARGPG
jgi:hypothetical protein